MFITISLPLKSGPKQTALLYHYWQTLSGGEWLKTNEKGYRNSYIYTLGGGRITGMCTPGLKTSLPEQAHIPHEKWPEWQQPHSNHAVLCRQAISLNRLTKMRIRWLHPVECKTNTLPKSKLQIHRLPPLTVVFSSLNVCTVSVFEQTF